jgi:hypothetical protein
MSVLLDDEKSQHPNPKRHDLFIDKDTREVIPWSQVGPNKRVDVLCTLPPQWFNKNQFGVKLRALLVEIRPSDRFDQLKSTSLPEFGEEKNPAAAAVDDEDDGCGGDPPTNDNAYLSSFASE